MATVLENESAFSTTALTNASVDTGINWAEGQDPGSVNNSARGMMAARAKARLDDGGGLAAGGTANALTVTTNQVLSAGHVTAGLRLLIRATADNTSATVTFAPDSLTAANIKRADGSALAIGSIKSGMYLDLVYNSGSSEWRCANIAPVPVGGSLGSAQASFSANKNGSNQAIASAAVTTVTWGTEASDVGAHFASNAWTPPAGTVLVSTMVTFLNVTSGQSAAVYLYKDGVVVAGNASTSGNSAAWSVPFQYMDIATGSNVYDIRVASSDGSYSVDGAAADSWFQGTMI